MRVCYTGGGTLGHVLPALSVHAVLKAKPGYECLFLGSRRKNERSAVESACVPYAGIFSGKLRRYFTFKTLFSGFGVLFGFLQSLLILSRYRPDVLFSKGGYVSVPPVLAAHLLRIPVVIHESDATAGLANRISSRYASRICVPFEGAGTEFPQEKVVVTGNPIRPSLSAPSGRDFTNDSGAPDSRSSAAYREEKSPNRPSRSSWNHFRSPGLGVRSFAQRSTRASAFRIPLGQSRSTRNRLPSVSAGAS